MYALDVSKTAPGFERFVPPGTVLDRIVAGLIFTNGRLFYTDSYSEPGTPDGMKVDIEGNVYCTGSAGIHVIAPNGQLLGRIHTPHPAANMAWGGPDWRTLYITARGVVYRTRLGIPGVPHGAANRMQALAMAGRS